MREVEILDCTIRDGSYMINFQYSKKIVAYLVKGLAEARIPKIEVGHGVGFDAERSQYEIWSAASWQTVSLLRYKDIRGVMNVVRGFSLVRVQEKR